MAEGYAGIPAGPLAAYLGVRRANEERSLADQRGQFMGIETLSRLGQLDQQQRDRIEIEQLKGVMAQSGGDPNKAVEALLKHGTPKAIALAGQLKGLVAKPEGQQIGTGLRMPDGTIIAPPAKPETPGSNIKPVTGGFLDLNQKNPDGSPKFTRTQAEPPSPVNERVVQDPASPTGWSYEDARTRVRRLGAPGPAGEKPRQIPAPVLTAMSTNQGNIRRAETALALLEGKDVTMKDPKGKDIVLKGDKNATGMLNYLPDAIVQRMDTGGIDARAYSADLGSMVIHDRSGAAVTAAEFPRLRPFIPLATDDPETARKKLRRFVAEYTAINNELKGMFSADQGYTQPGQGKTLRFDAQGNQL